jgi:RNA polymerase sigma-32 factor
MQQRIDRGDLSMEAPISRDEDSAQVGDFLAAAGTSAENAVGDAELSEVLQAHVRKFAETLDERDQRILNERILAEDPRTLQALADDYGLTRERVRQLEAGIVSRLQEYLKAELVDFEYYASEREAKGPKRKRRASADPPAR